MYLPPHSNTHDLTNNSNTLLYLTVGQISCQHACSFNTESSDKGEGKGNEQGRENKDMGDEEEEESGGVEEGKSGGVDSLSILQSQSESQAQESMPNHHNIDTAEGATAIPQSLTRRLLESGGDIRALLSSTQPLSSLWAQSADTGNRKEGAGQKIVKKDEDEEEEEKQEERFVRPRRLHLKQSKGAASDGFPSAIALSHRWHPDHMQDTHNLSIRAAFDTKYDEYYVFRHWRPSQGSSPPNKIHSNYTFL